MNNSNNRRAAAAVDGVAVSGGNDGARSPSPRLPHLRYTGLFSDKQIERPTAGGGLGGARLFTSFGRPWFQVESSQSSNPRPSAEDSRFSSSAVDDFRDRDLAASNRRVVGEKWGGTGDRPTYDTFRDSPIGHCRGDVDAVVGGNRAAHVFGLLPPPPKFSDAPSWATVPRSTSRMFVESKSIPTTVLDRPKTSENLSPTKTVVEKAKDGGSDDSVNDDDDDDDDDDVNNNSDVPPPPLPTSSPPRIPFSFFHTELENDAVVDDEQKPKASLALSVQSLFGVESDSSESREDDIRNESSSSNEEIIKVSIPCTERTTGIEKFRSVAAAVANESCTAAAAAEEVAPSNAARGETIRSNGRCPPVLDSIPANNSFLNSSSERFEVTASKSNADRRHNATAHDSQEEIEKTLHLGSVESCHQAKNVDNYTTRDYYQHRQIESSFRNAQGVDYKPTTTTEDFTDPLLHHTSAENHVSVSNVKRNPSDKDYEMDRAIIDQKGYTVDSARNQSNQRRDRSKGSEAVRHIGIANLMNTNAKNQTDDSDGADRRSGRIEASYINGSHFDDSTPERRDYYEKKTSSLLLSSYNKVNGNSYLLETPNKLDRPVLAEKDKCIKPKMYISTLSLYQQESEESACSARNSPKKQPTFDNLDKKLRDDARDRLQKLKSPTGSKPSFPTSGSCLPVIANATSMRGTLLSRDKRRSPNYETVLFPPRFGFQPPSFSGSLSRRKPGSLEDLRDWGTRSLPRNMECTDKWSVAKFDDSIDNYRKEEEEATGEAKDYRSPDKYYEDRKKSTNETDKYIRYGYHRLAFSLPRPNKRTAELQLQSAGAGNTNKHDDATSKETRQDKTSNSSSTNYSYRRTSAVASSDAASQPTSNLIASNSTLSVFIPSVPPITTEFPDSSVTTATHPHFAYQNLVQKSSFSTEATSVARSVASRDALPNISQIPIASDDKILPYSSGHILSRSSPSSSTVSSKSVSLSGNHSTPSSLVSASLVFSEPWSHLRPESSAPDSVSDSASTASAPVEFSGGGGERLPRPPGDGGGLSQVSESKDDAIEDSELDASFTYFRISHKYTNNRQTETEPPPKHSSPKYRSNLTVSVSSPGRLVVSDAELCPVPSNRRPLVDGNDARVSSVAGTRHQRLTELPQTTNASSENNNSVDTFLRRVNQSHIVDAMQSKTFSANEDDRSELRTGETDESKECLHWKPLPRERVADYKQKDAHGNGNTDDDSPSAVASNGVCGVHSSSIKFFESLANNESVNSNKKATEVHSLGHHKLRLVDEKTTPKTEPKMSQESRPESTHSTIGTAWTNPSATELSTAAPLPEHGGRSPKSDSKLSSTDASLKRHEDMRKPWSTGRETENQNHIGEEGTSGYMETRSSSISRWKISDKKEEDRGIPSFQGHTKPPTFEGGSTAVDSRTRNRIRGLENHSSSLIGGHRTTETDGERTIPKSTKDEEDSGGDDLIRIDIVKGSLGICFCLEGGKESPHGDGPIRIKRIFHGAPDFNAGREKLRTGDELISVNGQDLTSATHYAAWKHLRTLPEGVFTLVVRRTRTT